MVHYYLCVCVCLCWIFDSAKTMSGVINKKLIISGAFKREVKWIEVREGRKTAFIIYLFKLLNFMPCAYISYSK